MLEAAINQNPELPAFISQYKPTFPVGTADPTAALQYLDWPAGKRPLVPLMVFVDRQGIIRSEYSGADQDFFNEQQMDGHIRAEAQKLLAERAAPAKKKSAGKAN